MAEEHPEEEEGLGGASVTEHVRRTSGEYRDYDVDNVTADRQRSRRESSDSMPDILSNHKSRHNSSRPGGVRTNHGSVCSQVMCIIIFWEHTSRESVAHLMFFF